MNIKPLHVIAVLAISLISFAAGSSLSQDEGEIRLGGADTEQPSESALRPSHQESPDNLPRPKITPAAEIAKQTDTPTQSDAPVSRPLMPRIDSRATCHLQGILLGEEGSLSKSKNLHWRITFGPQEFTGYLQTTANGEFSITLKSALHEGAIGKLRLTPGTRPWGIEEMKPDTIEAQATLPLNIPQGSFDLGVLHFKALPTIAEGRVTDMSGTAIGDAKLEFEVLEPGQNHPMLWSVQSQGSTGVFKFRGLTKATYVQVTISKRGFKSITRSLPVGTENETFALERQ